jgi:serine/threonine protein kinase/tetratricopeptide (TPR) repeat protein
VQIYDIGMVDRRLFFVSELVEGLDLETLREAARRRRQPFPVDVAVFVVMEVASALSYLRRLSTRGGIPAAHAAGLSARDILLSLDGEVKLLHYGVTMARPPAPGAPGDVTLLGELLRALVPAAVAPTAAPAAPAALEALIARALSPNPVSRPVDADEVRTALGAILRTMKGPGAVPPIGDFLRGLAARPIVDRASLESLARSFDPRRGASPPTWKVITLTRLETGAAARPPRPAAPPVELVVGRVIPGTRYRVLSTIGEGGMGTVYAAEHVDLEKKVALKVLRVDVALDPDTLQQFRQEARAASKVGSAYICDVTDFGELADGRVFFVMEYLDGLSLGRVLREASRIEPARAIAILRQVAKALGAAHEKGIVHLDVKPDNVMLLAHGKRADAVKVVDFGIAGLIHQSGEEEEIAGTPEYIAPERASGHGYDSRSDVYALGVMAYEVLTGAVPFHGKNHVATLTMQVKDPPRPMRRGGGKHIPAELEAVVLRMLDKDPAARPQSMAEVEALLCEAQIAAGLTTDWDDLELPAVDEAWRLKLQRRMPSAAKPRKSVVIGAGSVLVASLAFSAYLALIRKPEVVVREVRVELTNTEEAPSVAAALMKADQAARRERYVRPESDSALYYIDVAEGEARRISHPSAGAVALRRAYASALAVVGNELFKADLRDLAVTKYKQALRFLPDDPDLQAKAELPLEERRHHDHDRDHDRDHHDEKRAVSPAAAAPAPSPTDETKDAATQVFLAATHGHLSEARLALATLKTSDASGVQVARLADALRGRATAAWTGGHEDEARPLYALVGELDPRDAEAHERATAAPGTAADDAAARGKRPASAPIDAGVAPRNTAASARATEAGAAAMGRGRLTEAESAFTRGVRADSTNAVAVAGLAEVAFERARYSDALDYARRASRLAPRSSKYLVEIGDAYFKLLRYDEALANYQRAAALSPRDATIRSRLDRVHTKIGK